MLKLDKIKKVNLLTLAPAQEKKKPLRDARKLENETDKASKKVANA